MKTGSAIGTTGYIAPEIEEAFDGNIDRCIYNYKVDIYSFGRSIEKIVANN